jgi:hypothetical protein
MWLLCALAGVAGCSQQPAGPPPSSAGPVVPPEIESVAQSVLGSEAEPLLWGDLARTGREQVLVANRLKAARKDVAPGILVTRVALVSKEEGKWVELFRCDEHLKNPKGYLAGTPLSPVSGWRLQYEQDNQKGFSMYFTPLARPAGGYIQTTGVRWNPASKRYQSLDRNFEKFQGETPALETVESQLRR